MTKSIAHWNRSRRRSLVAARPSILLLSVTLLAAAGVVRGAEPPGSDPFAALATEYRDHVRAVSKKYCLDCHATADPAGELDLERFATLADVRQDTKAWIKAAEMLDSGEMPPKDAEQPTAAERKQLRDWIARYLHAEALANAGDPGPVVLRRLNNAEYTYTVRDLTGAPLEPAKEFPADSAAGEGFANTGNSLVMSPALLTKYLDAGKAIAEHAKLLPDGFRFSPYSTRSDWTNETLAQIRELYARYSEESAGAQLNVQEVTIEAHGGGRLPIQKYLAASLAERDALRAGSKTVAAVAGEHQLNARYLGLLWERLEAPPGGEPSVLLDAIRTRWRSAAPGDAQAIADDVARWQKVLWRFNVIGQHIEHDGTNKQWQEGLTPLTSRQEVRVPLSVQPDGQDVSVYLVAGDAGDGHEDEGVVWHEPRLVASGRPDLPLRDLRDFAREMTARRTQLLAATARALAAADEVMKSTGQLDIDALAARHGLGVAELTPWLEYLGIGVNAEMTINLFTQKQNSVSGYDFVKGWGPPETPNLVASSSDSPVRVPGNMQPHGVCVHPSPTLFAVVGWKSPIRGTFTISGSVAHAHPECGNGVTWLLELRRGSTRQKLGEGISHGGAPVPLGPIADLAIQPGDLVALLIGPRDGNHSCDLTDVRLVLKSDGPEAREWALRDVSEDILAGNPHADRFGHPEVWYFGTEPVSGSDARTVVPPGSLLARWQAAPSGPEREKLAAELQTRLTLGPAAAADAQQPDAILSRQLNSLGGPLLARSWPQVAAALQAQPVPPDSTDNALGLDPATFGKLPDGTSIGASDLAVSTPAILEVRIPAELAQGAELVTAATLAPQPTGAGSAQAKVVTSRPEAMSLEPGVPVLVNDNSPARAVLEKAFAEFRELFPIALCYTKIVPVDEVVTLTLFHREDEPLRRLMLSPDETRQLNRLWDELYFVSQVPLKQVNAYEQIVEFATQDRPDLAEPFARLREPIFRAAQEFQQALVAAEPAQLEAIVEFAAQAYRRPLTESEAAELRGLYQKLRQQELPHEEAFRFTLARVFVAPAFLYRLEKAPPGSAPAAVTDWELASRLSYFLWSSQPDAELRAAAAAGKLHEPDALVAQARRMLTDSRIRRLATEFACQWLHIYEFDTLDEKSGSHFPEFAELRGAMYEEAILFFTDAFQHDGSVLSLFDADHTFVNDRLAQFYGIPNIAGPEWRRVAGVRQYGRGGLLALSATLAKQSGASRTSPILRGNWVSEFLLGEKLPRPPKDVPVLPEDETATAGLTVRQLVMKHTSDTKCSGCHQKIDPFGFALEGYDAIGRRREVDLANRPVETKTSLPDGREIEGLPGLRAYLVETRREAIVRSFCKKLLGYALGRGTQLSDEPLLTEMQQQLAQHDYRLSVAVETILRSPQFREIRGRDAQFADGL